MYFYDLGLVVFKTKSYTLNKHVIYVWIYKTPINLEWIDDPVSQLLILNIIISQETCYSL